MDLQSLLFPDSPAWLLQIPDLIHLSLGESNRLLRLAPPDHGAVGVGPGFTSGSASYPALPDDRGFSLGAAGSFRSPSVTSGLRDQMGTGSSFVPEPARTSVLQDFSLLPGPVQLDPSENTMEDLQNLVDPQNQQPVKYDLLNSIPRESTHWFWVSCPVSDGPLRVCVCVLVLVLL